jgi:hypothetical protein
VDEAALVARVADATIPGPCVPRSVRAPVRGAESSGQLAGNTVRLPAGDPPYCTVGTADVQDIAADPERFAGIDEDNRVKSKSAHVADHQQPFCRGLAGFMPSAWDIRP